MTPQETLLPPWRHGGRYQSPDLVCRFGSTAWLLDAKYKPRLGEGKVPSMADLSPLYAYTLLQPKESGLGPATTVRAALVFPRVGEHPARRVGLLGDWAARQSIWLPGASSADGVLQDAVDGGGVQVGRLMVDYPQPTMALCSDDAWRRYISAVGAGLVDVLSEGRAGTALRDSGRVGGRERASG